MSDTHKIAESAIAEAGQAITLDALDAVRVKYLGKKGALTEQLKSLGKLPAEERPEAGRLINVAKKDLAGAIEQRKAALDVARMEEEELSRAHIDVTLPGRGCSAGSAHPISQTMSRIENIFVRWGFEVCDGPEVEDGLP